MPLQLIRLLLSRTCGSLYLWEYNKGVIASTALLATLVAVAVFGVNVIINISRRLAWSGQQGHLVAHPSLEGLPLDLALEMLSYLSVRELCTLERVSRKLQLSVNERAVWIHVLRDIHSVKPLSYLVDTSVMSTASLKSMAIRAVRLHNNLSREGFQPLQIATRDTNDGILTFRALKIIPGRKWVTCDRAGELRLYDTSLQIIATAPPPVDIEPYPVDWAHTGLYVFPISQEKSYTLHLMIQVSEEWSNAPVSVTVSVHAVSSSFQRLRCIKRALPVCTGSIRDDCFAYGWINTNRDCFVYVHSMPEATSRFPADGACYQLLDYQKGDVTSKYHYNAVSICLLPDGHIALANKFGVWLYALPLTSGSTSTVCVSPFWSHVAPPRKPYWHSDPVMTYCPPTVPDRMRLVVSHQTKIILLEIMRGSNEVHMSTVDTDDLVRFSIHSFAAPSYTVNRRVTQGGYFTSCSFLHSSPGAHRLDTEGGVGSIRAMRLIVGLGGHYALDEEEGILIFMFRTGIHESLQFTLYDLLQEDLQVTDPFPHYLQL